MWHPLAGLEAASLTWLLVISAAVAGVIFLRLENTGRALRNSVAPLGIVSLSTAATPRESGGILRSWDDEGRAAARRHLTLDYAFIPFFSTAVTILGILSARWFDRHGHTTYAQIAMGLAWGQWIVALFDFAENSFLLRILQLYPEVPTSMTRLVGGCARIKLVGVLGMVAAGLFSWLSFLA